MTRDPTLICSAGNVEVPAYLVLCEQGYAVTPSDKPMADKGWTAAKGDLRFQADSLIELLGLVAMVSNRGTEWRATDEDIDTFLRAYGE